MKFGVLFRADGEKYRQEAAAAREQLLSVWPEVAVHIDTIPGNGAPPMLARIWALQRSPFDQTLYLDTDTWVLEPVPELFRLLEHFDIGLPLSVYREVYPVDVPGCFPELSGCVMVWNSRPIMDQLFKDWERRFRRQHEERQGVSHPEVGFFHCQPSLREALYHSQVRLAVLPDEYAWQASGYVHHRVRIVHKRPHPEEEAAAINRDAGRPRTKLLFGEVQVWR